MRTSTGRTRGFRGDPVRDGVVTRRAVAAGAARHGAAAGRAPGAAGGGRLRLPESSDDVSWPCQCERLAHLNPQ